jgi:hypothetical protein
MQRYGCGATMLPHSARLMRKPKMAKLREENERIWWCCPLLRLSYRINDIVVFDIVLVYVGFVIE